MRVAIGADHAGVELKEAVKGFLAAENHEPLDVGTSSKDPVDYSDYAVAVSGALSEGRAERGIIPCFTEYCPGHLRWQCEARRGARECADRAPAARLR